MEFFITRSKYVSETISLAIDFSDVLPAGGIISGVPTVTVSVFSGIDPTPADILYLGVSVVGSVVSQRVRLGIPGVIYQLTFTVASSALFFVKETVLAILPQDGSAIPTSLGLFLTSDLYPLQTNEEFSASFSTADGSMWFNPTTQEMMQSSFSTMDGSFVLAQLFLSMPEEAMQSSFSAKDGVWIPANSVTYTTQPESFSASFAPLTGTFIVGQVFYTTPAESFKTSFAPLNGTFS